jgi:hydroxypyruvate reductase
MTLQDKIEVSRVLLMSGAPISAMNVVRKHLSMIKGGRLAAATKARVVTFVVSDVAGDDPALVASGPTIVDFSTSKYALEIVEQYRLKLPAAARLYLASETASGPRPSDKAFERNSHYIVASARLSLEAAASAARDAGVAAVILSDAIEGESRHIASMHAAIAREVICQDQPFSKPVILLSGGETTVTLQSAGGRGGRNTEFALAAAVGLQDVDVDLLAADTDGIDGSGTNAGAFVDGATVRRLRLAGLDPQEVLSRNDSYAAFSALGDLFEPGPTGTNVNDFRAIFLR